MQLYTSTSFLLLAMSLLVTGSTYLGESIICSLHSPIMYYDVSMACSMGVEYMMLLGDTKTDAGHLLLHPRHLHSGRRT